MSFVWGIAELLEQATWLQDALDAIADADAIRQADSWKLQEEKARQAAMAREFMALHGEAATEAWLKDKVAGLQAEVREAQRKQRAAERKLQEGEK